jgi:hypothetical protein
VRGQEQGARRGEGEGGDQNGSRRNGSRRAHTYLLRNVQRSVRRGVPVRLNRNKRELVSRMPRMAHGNDPFAAQQGRLLRMARSTTDITGQLLDTAGNITRIALNTFETLTRPASAGLRCRSRAAVTGLRNDRDSRVTRPD